MALLGSNARRVDPASPSLRALCVLAAAVLTSTARRVDAAPPTACPSGRNVTFFGPWAGGDAWLVNYTGPFDNDRPPHVQLGSNPGVTAGQVACLSHCGATTGKAIEWEVDGVFNSALNETAHIILRAERGSGGGGGGGDRSHRILDTWIHPSIPSSSKSTASVPSGAALSTAVTAR